MLGVALEFKNLPDTTTPINATNLNIMQKLLVDLIYPVGIYVEISDSNFNPNTAWGGTWVLENDGTVLVSKSNINNSIFNNNIESIIGEENHILTINEIPNHKHSLNYGTSIGSDGTGLAYSNTEGSFSGYDINGVGGNKAHNNVQPSKITNRWHRTA